jgi:5-methylcytosine-specific restriction protein A
MTPSVCNEPGCPRFAVRRGRCLEHARLDQRRYDASRGGRQARGYGAGWAAVRAFVLERDGHLCRVRGPRCTGTATTCDHIVPVIDGGALHDPANLRASCARCNFGHRGARPSPAYDAPTHYRRS